MEADSRAALRSDALTVNEQDTLAGAVAVRQAAPTCDGTARPLLATQLRAPAGHLDAIGLMEVGEGRSGRSDL
jgi:hypothetical protein